MIIKMLTKLGRRMDGHSENFSKEVEYTKKKKQKKLIRVEEYNN